MSIQQYSLDKLWDIVIPDAPPLWPLAPGAWVVLGMVALLLLLIFVQIYVAWRRNAYRRAGIVLLDSVKTVHDVSVVLKRVALAVFPRQQVASLYGKDWVDFLNRSCSRSRFAETDMADPGAAATPRLIELANTWIRHHGVAAYRTDIGVH